MTRTRRKQALARVVIASLLAPLAGCSTTIRQSPELEDRIERVERVGIMPAEVTIVRDVLKGQDERLHDLEERIANHLPRALAREIRRLDIETSRVDFGENQLSGLPDLRFEVAQLQERFEEELDVAYASPTMQEKKAMVYESSMGPQVAPVADLLDADALMFTRLRGYKRSAGNVAKDVIIGVAGGPKKSSEQLVLHGCLVDGITGDILWCNSATRSDAEASPDELVAGLLSPLTEKEE